MALWARVLQLPIGRTLSCCLLVNLAVHTLFWYTQPVLFADWPLGLYRAELLVILIEAAAYARCLALRITRAWLISLTLNAASLLVGMWLWQRLL